MLVGSLAGLLTLDHILCFNPQQILRLGLDYIEFIWEVITK